MGGLVILKNKAAQNMGTKKLKDMALWQTVHTTLLLWV
jgi:hypothetical protein